MASLVDTIRFVNEQDFYQLLPPPPPPTSGEPADAGPLDDDEIRAQNAREFYRFELRLPVVTDAYSHVKQYAAVRERLSDGQNAKPRDDRALALEKIHAGMKDEAVRRASHMPSSPGRDSEDPLQTLSQHADSVERTGTSEGRSRSWTLSSARDLLSTVARKTNVNKWIERLLYGWSRQPAFNETERHGEGAAALYEFLARRDCSVAEHRGLLKLSDFGRSTEGDFVYDMFLPVCEKCCPEQTLPGWQKTTCTLESQKPPFTKQIRICSEIGDSRRRRTPLRLSFDEQRVWLTLNKPGAPSSGFLSERDKIATFDLLDDLLKQGHLQGQSRADRIRKYRLALRLGLSLQALCTGPWLQELWTAQYVRVLRDKATAPVERLDEAYITCAITQHRHQDSILPSAPPESVRELCPEFFLSFAQLLLDIEKGEMGYRHPSAEPLNRWYDVLYETIDMSPDMEGDLSTSYRAAIEGCMLYSANYKNEAQNMNDEKQLKREVIRKHIVSPLRTNLEKWTSMEESDRAYDDLDDRTQTSTSTRPREDYTSPFTLWDHRYDRYNEQLTQEEITSMMEPPAGTVTAHMQSFINRAQCPQAKAKEASYQRVRIAVIDTGFNSNMDPLLTNPAFQSRVKDKQNFFSDGTADPSPEDWEDTDGHGTHVARILLRLAPRADIYVAKIARDKSLVLRDERLLKALQWAGERADIINLSFSLGMMPNNPALPAMIDKLLLRKKLIFAAASNQGANSSRPWPARQPGVFCIHATTEESRVDEMNLQPVGQAQHANFATLGCDILSYWRGRYVSVSGTSFASPVAAAIAANVLDYARRHLPATSAEQFQIFENMRKLFFDHMTENNAPGVYHIIKPWRPGLWDNETSDEDICKILNGLWSGTGRPA